MLESKRPYLIPLKERLSLAAEGAGQGQPEELDRPHRRVHARDHRRELPVRRDRRRLRRAALPRGRAAVVPGARPRRPLAQPAAPVGRLARCSPTTTCARSTTATRCCSTTACRCRGASSRSAAACSSVSTCTATLRVTSAIAPATTRRCSTSPKSAAAPVDPEPFWESVKHEEGDRVVLTPQRFYLLMSNEAVCIPPTLASEMTAYDPTSGELRTHYAGFFDPGFGFDPGGAFGRIARRARSARARRAVHDRARSTRLQAHVRAHARGARPSVRAGHRLELPGPGRDPEQALRADHVNAPETPRLVPADVSEAGRGPRRCVGRSRDGLRRASCSEGAPGLRRTSSSLCRERHDRIGRPCASSAPGPRSPRRRSPSGRPSAA